MFSPDCRVLAAFAVATSLAASISSITPTVAFAQSEETTERHDVEAAGGSRGGYAWGEETGSGGGGGASAPTHRFARIFGSVGAGVAVRIIEYVELEQQRLAPAYLQLRPGYFFEGDGTFQHGVMLGVAAALQPDGTVMFGHDAFGQWVLAPSYVVRAWLDGELGQYLQLTGRVGVPLALGQYFSWGIDVGVGAIIEFLTGIGLYVEANFSMFFATDIHPLVGVEGGLVIEYEVLP